MTNARLLPVIKQAHAHRVACEQHTSRVRLEHGDRKVAEQVAHELDASHLARPRRQFGIGRVCRNVAVLAQFCDEIRAVVQAAVEHKPCARCPHDRL